MTDYNVTIPQIQREYVKAYEELFGSRNGPRITDDFLPFQKFYREWSGYLKTMYPPPYGFSDINSQAAVYILYAIAEQVYRKTVKLLSYQR
jgi:hypothetical protein